MKAVILAAGKGERLGSLVRSIPKPMISVGGRPLIEHNILKCRDFGVTDIHINLHYFPEIFRNHLGDGSRFGVKIAYHFEEELLGTSGTVKNLEPVLGAAPFFVLYGDNLSNYELKAIYDQHNAHQAEMSIAVFLKEKDLRLSGMVELDPAGWIRAFVEKPEHQAEVSSQWVNAGIYLVNPSIFPEIPIGISDFGRNVIPNLVGQGRKILGVRMDSPVVAIDTPKLYEEVGMDIPIGGKVLKISG